MENSTIDDYNNKIVIVEDFMETSYLDIFKEYHNNSGPARILYDYFGRKTKEIYYNHGIISRIFEDGPAIIDFHTNGKIDKVFFVFNGYRRRLESPFLEDLALK